MKFYDRKGGVVSQREFEILMGNRTYKRVLETTLPDGKWISTVWLGLDHSFESTSPPLIFETMVFPSCSDFLEMDVNRYSTEEEAIQGHQEIVENYLKKIR